MKMGDIIRNLRIQKGMTQEELGNVIGVQKSAIRKYESGMVENIKRTSIKKMAQLFGVSPTYLMGMEDKAISNINDFISIKKTSIRLLGTVSCGKPTFAEENFECYVDSIPSLKIDFALRATGDSMIDARIYDGDLVFVRQQEIVENGDIAVVLIGDEATLKRFFYDKDKQTVTLVAANNKYAPMIYSGAELENIRVLGKAVAFQSLIN